MARTGPKHDSPLCIIGIRGSPACLKYRGLAQEVSLYVLDSMIFKLSVQKVTFFIEKLDVRLVGKVIICGLVF
jgi:hypothetical protein